VRIDSHQHFWLYNSTEYDWIDDSMAALRRDFLPCDLQPELAQAQFDGSIAVQARQTLCETRWLLELAASSPQILGVIGWIDLCSPDARTQLESFAANPKLLGIRHIVQSEPDPRFLLRPEFLRGVALLEEFDLSYDILIYPRHLQAAAEFARHFPHHRLVLDHLAKPPIRDGSLVPWKNHLRELAQSPNVFCKLSGMVTEADWHAWTPEHFTPYLDCALEYFGPERLMIGSDWPVCTVAAPYSTTMSIVMDNLARYRSDVSDAVLGGNAQRFWKLTRT
jgi:L-fuconolactonase